jgi:hypothetical protein
MSSCPNNDKNFNKILEKLLGRPPTPLDRNQIYYMVCITLRISIASLLLICRDRPWVPYVFFIGSLVALYNFYSSGFSGDQWWSKKFQCIMALIIFAVSVVAIFYKINTFILPVLFFLSISAGLLQSFIIPRC